LQGRRIHSAHSDNSEILRILVQTKGIYIVKVSSSSETRTFKAAVK